LLKKITSEALGLSDIGEVIAPSHYSSVESDDYIFTENNEEKIYFLIKSKSDEYCFTNKGLLHLDGDSALSKKRTLKRYNYSTNLISDVYLETAGTVDLDVEIIFTMGDVRFKIDVHKKHLEQVKDLYKTLLKIEETQTEANLLLKHSKESLAFAQSFLEGLRDSTGDVVEQSKALSNLYLEWSREKRKQFIVRDFGYLFELYINN